MRVYRGPAWLDVDSLSQALYLAVICTQADTVLDLIAAMGRREHVTPEGLVRSHN